MHRRGSRNRRAGGKLCAGGIVGLLGVTAPGRDSKLDIGRINRTMVLDNQTVFGSVNANRRHYELAAGAPRQADQAWLAGLITRTSDRWTEAIERRPGDIKVIVDFAESGNSE
jgi:glucose 1-dehydrogenase